MGGAPGLGYRLGVWPVPASPAVGDLVREWRQRRRLSQLDLACEAEISTRHLSFIETGRVAPEPRDGAAPRRAARRAAARAQPAAGRGRLRAAYSRERPLDDPALDAAREAVELVLRGHEPYPALAVDRHWTLVAANAAVAPLLAGVAPGAARSRRSTCCGSSLHPRRPRAADRQPRRVARASARAAAPAGRRRPATRCCARCSTSSRRTRRPRATRGRPRRRATTPASSCRCSSSRRRARCVLQHDHGLRHAGRRHAVRARHRGVLPGRAATAERLRAVPRTESR